MPVMHSEKGAAFVDWDLYLPREWPDDAARRRTWVAWMVNYSSLAMLRVVLTALG